VIILAGPSAQRRSASDSLNWKNPSDFKELRLWIEAWRRDDWGRYEEEMIARADEPVVQYGPEIEAVAKALLDHETLTGDEIGQVIGDPREV